MASDKQTRFIDEYLIDLNATQAAIRAGYSVKGAGVQGFYLLRNPKIAEEITARQLERSQAIASKLNITEERVMAELAKIAFTDTREVVRWGTKEIMIGFDDDGKKLAPADIGDAVLVLKEMASFVEPIDSDDLDADASGAVKSVALTKDGGFRIELHDKRGALELIGRKLKLFLNRTSIENPDGSAVAAPLAFTAVYPTKKPDDDD